MREEMPRVTRSCGSRLLNAAFVPNQIGAIKPFALYHGSIRHSFSSIAYSLHFASCENENNARVNRPKKPSQLALSSEHVFYGMKWTSLPSPIRENHARACYKPACKRFLVWLMRKPKPYPTETTDDASAIAAPSLPVIATQSPQRPSAGRVMVNPLGGIGRAGAPRHLRPTDFPPREAVAQQPQRWVDGGWLGTIGTV